MSEQNGTYYSAMNSMTFSGRFSRSFVSKSLTCVSTPDFSNRTFAPYLVICSLYTET